MVVRSPSPGLLVTAHVSGHFSPHKSLAALETRAQVTLQTFISLPRVRNSLNGCCPELVLSASGPGRKNHTVCRIKQKEKMKAHTVLLAWPDSIAPRARSQAVTHLPV